MSQKGKLCGKLAKHPRMIGVLFTLSVVLMQAGAVLAQNGANSGP
ncbi:DUF7503 family protein [Haladaptatus sp. NG-SE-30]